MTVREEQNNTASSTNPQREKTIASIREQIAASTTDEERAVFEDALKRELALKDKPVSAAPVAQTMDPDKDPEHKKDEEEQGCFTKCLICIGDIMEAEREMEEEMFTKSKKNAKNDKK